MMKLSTMSAIMLTCTPRDESPLADALIGRWFTEHGPARFFRVSANCLFTVEAGGQRYVLRFNHAEERTVDYWLAEAAFLRHLAAAGILVALPITSLNGLTVETLKTDIGELHGMLFPALPGKSWPDATACTREELQRWGAALGALHRASETYLGPDNRPTWRDHLAMVTDRLPAEDADARTVLAQVTRELEALPIDNGNFGLIHFDFEQDNLLWDGDHPGIIDFDDCAWYWYAADIAFCLRDLYDDRADRINLVDPAIEAFLHGYRQQRVIADEEIARIPLFARLHHLVTCAKLLRSLEDGPQPAEPSWMPGLRKKLQQVLQRYRETFAVLATAPAK